jgi:S1-C subfamily serine protease
MHMHKKLIKLVFTVIAVFLIFFSTGMSCFAKEINKLYIYRGRDLQTISNLFNEFIAKKKYYVYKADVNQGFFYIQPSYWGMFDDGDYIVLSVNLTESGDSIVFIRCNYNSQVMRDSMLEYLKKNNCKYQLVKDDELLKKYSESANEKLTIKPQLSNPQIKTTNNLVTTAPIVESKQEEVLIAGVSQTSGTTQQQINKVQTTSASKTVSSAAKPAVKTVKTPVKQVSRAVSSKSKASLKPNTPAIKQQTSSITATAPFREISKAGLVFKKVNRGIVTVFSSVSHGSGFLVDKSGLVLTNYHVVREQEEGLKVRFGQGEVLAAKVLVTDPTNDVAVVQVNLKNMENYTVIPLFSPPASEPLVVVGESILAVGSPLSWADYEKTMTQGVVGKYENGIIMHDASVNHGNSGGPLINYGGYVVGINSFAPSNEDNNGLSGAIAINRAFPSLDKAFSAAENSELPSPEFLPDIPKVSYDFEIMKAEYSNNKYTGRKDVNDRDTPYIINGWNYDVFMITPPQKYRALANNEEEVLAKHKKRLNKAGLNFSTDEYDSKNLASIEYNKALVQILVMPKPKMTTGSTVLSALSLTAGILCAISSSTTPYYYTPRNTYQYEFKKDFDKISLFNSSKNTELTPISSGKAPVTQDILQYYSSQNIQIQDKTYIGLYEFDPKDFYNTDEMVLKLYSMDGKPPKTVTIPQEFKNNIVQDFMPYWNYLEKEKEIKN